MGNERYRGLKPKEERGHNWYELVTWESGSLFIQLPINTSSGEEEPKSPFETLHRRINEQNLPELRILRQVPSTATLEKNYPSSFHLLCPLSARGMEHSAWKGCGMHSPSQQGVPILSFAGSLSYVLAFGSVVVFIDLVGVVSCHNQMAIRTQRISSADSF